MAPDAAFFCHASLPPSTNGVFQSLAAPVAGWFQRSFASPTSAQRFAWPILARGENLLLSAPTGTGKTLAAFLPVISALGDEAADGLACLYVAPLKALTRDVAKNLRRALRGLQAPGLRIGVRTGDTSAHARRRQLEMPPQLLLTTPESLAVLLTNPHAPELFRTLRWVIVDEIHALIGDKRGSDLALSLERVAALASSSLQRIGLSATCAPAEGVAHFLVGVGRPCTIAQVPDRLAMNVTIEPLADNQTDVGFLARLVKRLEAELAANRTTLIFANARGMAERLTWALKRRYPDSAERIAVHHSSVAVQSRRLVERRLKKGALEVVVSSTSLELGIDIGHVDGVVLVHPPGGVARFLQRIGRSGHRPDGPRRGLVLTSGQAELAEATITLAASRAGQLEPLDAVAQPLDVLCQHLVGMAITDEWTSDDAYRLVRRAYAYRDLTRDDFERCLAYLSGRHADGRTWLPARLRWEGERFSIVNSGTAKLLRRNLGTILTEVACAVRLVFPNAKTDDDAGSRTRKSSGMRPNSCEFGYDSGPPSPSIIIGSVDDAYADRLRPGDRLLLGGRCLEYRRRERGAVLVDEASTRPIVPRWAGSTCSLTGALAERLFHFRTLAGEALRDGPESLRGWLQSEYGLGEAAAADLAEYLLLQETMSEIPDARTLLVEAIDDDLGTSYYVHTPLPRAGNDGLARVAAHRFARARDRDAVTVAADLGFVLAAPCGMVIAPQEWRDLLAERQFDADLAEAVRDSGSLRERFAQVATTGLMTLRNPLGGRRKVGGPNWAERRLFDQVRQSDPGFVLLRQAEREVVTEVCAVDAARDYAARMPMRQVRCRRLSRVSPFAASWLPMGNAEAVAAPADALSRLHAELIGA